MASRIVLALIAVVFVSATTERLKPENKKLVKDYVYVPAQTEGTKSFNGFYISSTEVTNKQYREFLLYLRVKGTIVEEKKAAVDTNLWKTFLAYNEPYADYYHKHPLYDDYPVVNITKEGAELYCKWLTEKYNATAKVKVEFRLPTEAEWMLAAKGGHSDAIYPWNGSSLKYEKKGKYFGEYMANYRVGDAMPVSLTKINNDAFITAPGRSFIANDYGIFNMAGNVAEMVQDGSFSKGGGWANDGEDLKITARDGSSKGLAPSPNIGFRPVMVLKQQ